VTRSLSNSFLSSAIRALTPQPSDHRNVARCCIIIAFLLGLGIRAWTYVYGEAIIYDGKAQWRGDIAGATLSVGKYSPDSRKLSGWRHQHRDIIWNEEWEFYQIDPLLVSRTHAGASVSLALAKDPRISVWQGRVPRRRDS
jgi:hypothetical protein